CHVQTGPEGRSLLVAGADGRVLRRPGRRREGLVRQLVVDRHAPGRRLARGTRAARRGRAEEGALAGSCPKERSDYSIVIAVSGARFAFGGSHSSIRFPSGSRTHPNRPYFESSMSRSTSTPSARSAA